MPPKRQHEDGTALKEKLQQSANPHNRRNGKTTAVNGSALKEVDNASSQTSNDTNPSNVSPSPPQAAHHDPAHLYQPC
jgi:histone deacetylase complex subunit SAP30